jgi:hypothetical protein
MSSFEENVLKPILNELKALLEKKDEIERTYEKIKNTEEWGYFCPTHGWVEAEEGLVEHEHVWIDDKDELQGVTDYIRGMVCKICKNPEGVYQLPRLDYNDLKNVIKYGMVYERIIDDNPVLTSRDHETVLSENGYIFLDYKAFSVPFVENVIKMLRTIKKVYELFRSLRMHIYVKKSNNYNADDSLYNLIEKALSEISNEEIEKMTGIAKFEYTISSALFRAGIPLSEIDNYEVIDKLDYSIISYNFFTSCNGFIIYEHKVFGRKNSNAKEKLREILNTAATKYRDLERKAYENNKKNPPEVPFIAQWASGGVYKDPYRRVVLLADPQVKHIDDEIIVFDAELRPSRKDPTKTYWFATKFTTRKMIYEETLKNCR